MPAPVPAVVPTPFIALQSAGGAQRQIGRQAASNLAWTMLPICRLYADSLAEGWQLPTGFVESEWQTFLDTMPFLALSTLLLESGDHLLLESGDRIALEV